MNWQPPSFLIVDDNVPLSELIVRVIYRVAPDADVTQVGCVGDALAALRARRFTALLVDYRLPDGDGLEVIAWVRDNMPQLPVVALSGLRIERELQAGGATYTLSKPFHLDHLTTILRSILEEA